MLGTKACHSLRKKCPYSELFWSAFSRIRTAYGEIFCISPYSVRMRENKDQNNSEYGPFLRSACIEYIQRVFACKERVHVEQVPPVRNIFPGVFGKIVALKNS